MREALILEYVRTPMGRYGGALSTVRPDDLAALVIAEVVRRAALDPAQIDDVVLGCANQAGEDNRNVARMAALLAGLPVAVPGVTVNRLCGSGLQAVVDSARQIALGEAEIVIAGGVESMSRAPLVMAKPSEAFPRGEQRLYDSTLGWRFINPRMKQQYDTLQMGETAERVAERYQVSREAQDEFACQSQHKCARALADGRLREELVPVEAPGRKGPTRVELDEQPRPDATREALAKLRPAFAANGTVTAGNSSGLNDGAAALVLASPEAARKIGRAPLARFVGSAVAGVEPSYMGIGPVPATRRLLGRLGLSIGAIDVVELNEAFAAQALACLRELEIDPARVNPLGGAIALGHPLGCSGARLAGTLIRQLARTGARWGLATMCIGVGQGIAAVFERC
ncbi:MAG TPA: acetyl-CoA C-acyltransferase [Polyangia bacterium]|nr:acetyl-CoA C-acyltransferase [Polyangia bacterium]